MASSDQDLARSGPKQPPPERPTDIRRRSYIILSFWLLVLCLGVPIWWRTTAIYRANLPLDEMLRWAEGKACRPIFPLRVSLDAGPMQAEDAQNLIRLTQHVLDDQNDFNGHHLRLSAAHEQANQPLDSQAAVALTIRLSPGESTASSLDPHSSILDITYPSIAVPSRASSTSTLASYIASELQSTFAEEQAIISYLLSTSSTSSELRTQNLSPEETESLTKRTTRSLRYAPTYHLAFSLFTSGSTPSTWDVETAIDDYMRPMLDVLNPIHNFTIDTQVQLYATPGVHSQILSKDDLASFVNAAEWPLSPSIGGAPTVNFIVYVGNQTIQLDNEHSRSWLIPQWGTVYLLPVPPADHVDIAALRDPMLTFAGHLLSLLGTPQSTSLPLRLSTLSRVRSADLLLRASTTLGSLARLSLALPSISIPRSVADGVAKSISHLEMACSRLGEPQGLEHARIAEEEAERAFFEKSMMGRLYFPDEHKIAVYLPLLGPMCLPLIMGLISELKAWRKRREERLATKAEKSL